MRTARTGLIVAAALLALGGCASAEDLAASGASDSNSEATDEPTDTEEPSDEPTEEPTAPTPTAGDCRMIANSELSRGVVTAAKSAKCGKKHNAQTFYVTNAKGATKQALTKGDLTKVYKQTESTCNKQLQSWTGGNAARLARTGYYTVVGAPTAEDVVAGASWVRCDVTLYQPSGSTVDLPKDTRGSLKKQTSDADYCIKGMPKPANTNVVLCNKPHDFRSVGVVKFGGPSDSYPGRKKVRGGMRKPCVRQARKFLGKGRYTAWTYPTPQNWKDGDRFGECYAKTKK